MTHQNSLLYPSFLVKNTTLFHEKTANSSRYTTILVKNITVFIEKTPNQQQFLMKKQQTNNNCGEKTINFDERQQFLVKINDIFS